METERIERNANVAAPASWETVLREPTFSAIPAAPRDLETIVSTQSSLLLPHFTSDDAFTLGCQLRSRLTPNPLPLVIGILSPSSPSSSTPRTLFYTCTHPGTVPDNDIWVQRKAATVFRFGVPTWQMHVKFAGNEKDFAAKYGIGPNEVGKYAIHGGGVPIRVKGVEGVVAVVIVSGLKQDEDHAVVVEGIQKFLSSLSA